MRIKEVRRASRWLLQLGACDGYNVVARQPHSTFYLCCFFFSALTIVKLATGTQFSLTTQRIVFNCIFDPIVSVCYQDQALSIMQALVGACVRAVSEIRKNEPLAGSSR